MSLVMPVSIAIVLVTRPRYGIIFAQRIPFPAFGHHDASQIGMVQENDPEEVECFALIPVGGAINAAGGFDLWALAREPRFDAQTRFVGDGLQMVDNLEARLGRE